MQKMQNNIRTMIKIIKNIAILSLSILMIMGCQDNKDKGIDSNSIFNLTSEWQKPDGQKIQLKELKGKVLAVVMIYTSCKTACPRLTYDMKKIASKVGAENSDDMRYVLVSIDPEKDTPAAMKEFLVNNEIDNQQWLFLRSNEANTREFANVLAVKYKQISPMDFSHSNIISVFSKNGLLVHQKEGLNIDIDQTVNAIKSELK